MAKKFYSAYDYPERLPQPPMSPYVSTFEFVIDKTTGKKVLMDTGKTNIRDKIQASLQDTLIYNMLEKYQKTGDSSLLNRLQGQYADISEAPASLVEAKQKVFDAEKLYYSLRPDIRDEFGGSLGEFLKSFETGKASQVIDKYTKVKEVDKSISEVMTSAPQQDVLNQQAQIINQLGGTINE